MSSLNTEKDWLKRVIHLFGVIVLCMFVEARAHEFYVCYQKKILLEEHKPRYIGCIAHEEKCKTFNMKHFGKYLLQNL